MAAALSLSFFPPFFSSFRWKSLLLICWSVSVSMPSRHGPQNSARFPAFNPNPTGTWSELHARQWGSHALALLGLSLPGGAGIVKWWSMPHFRDPSLDLTAFQLGWRPPKVEFSRGQGAPHAWHLCKVTVSRGKEDAMAPPEWGLHFHTGKALLEKAREGYPADNPHQLWSEDRTDLDINCSSSKFGPESLESFVKCAICKLLFPLLVCGWESVTSIPNRPLSPKSQFPQVHFPNKAQPYCPSHTSTILAPPW